MTKKGPVREIISEKTGISIKLAVAIAVVLGGAYLEGRLALADLKHTQTDCVRMLNEQQAAGQLQAKKCLTREGHRTYMLEFANVNELRAIPHSGGSGG